MRISPVAQEYIRKRAAELMADACIIYNTSDPVLDLTTGRIVTPSNVTKYDGPCRFWEVSAGQEILMGDEQITMSQSYLSLPWNAPVPETDDTVELTASTDDSMVGKTVQVISIVRAGGLRASRRMLVRIIESEKDTW